jgi:hypothetical protein
LLAEIWATINQNFFPSSSVIITDDLNLLSFWSVDKHTGWVDPITGMPCEVPVPRNFNFIFGFCDILVNLRKIIQMPQLKQYLTPKQKALVVNLDPNIYGTFAEIGAGQETVRHFFRAGGASGTIAKAMSAYDKDYSDAIYGKKNIIDMLIRTDLENASL